MTITPPLAVGVRLSLRHDLGGKPYHVECPDQVDGDRAGETVQCVRAAPAENLLAGRSAGTIHQSVDVPEFLFRKCQSGGGVGLIRHVGISEAHLRAELGGRLFPRWRLQVQPQHCRALLSQHARHSRAEPGTGPRNDKDAALELHRLQLQLFPIG